MRTTLAIAIAVLLVAHDARAGDDVVPTGHVALGVGGATKPRDFRLSLDASLGLAYSPASNDQSFTFNGGVITGFGRWPTYLLADVGYAFLPFGTGTSSLVGVVVNAGPAWRVAPTNGVGGELNLRLFITAIQIGVHSVGIATHGAEAQVELTVGLGWL